MAEIKISQLAAASLPLTGAEIVPLTQGGTTLSASVADIAAAGQAGGRVHVYVSAAAGDDSNDGLTAQTPIRNGQTFVDRYNAIPGFGVTMHFDAGAHTAVKWPAGWGRESSLVMAGDGAGQGGDGMTEQVTAEASQAGSTVGIIVTLTAVLDATHRGSILEVTSGLATGARRSIIAVPTGTSVTLARALPANWVVGDSFRIIRPGAVITYDSYELIAQRVGTRSRTDSLTQAPDVAVVWLDLEVNCTALAGAGAPAMLDSRVVAFGTRITGTAAGGLLRDIAMMAAPARSAIDANRYAGIAPVIAGASPTYPTTAAALASLWGGCGLTFDTDAQVGELEGYVVRTGDSRLVCTNGRAAIEGGAGGWSCESGGEVIVDPPTDSSFVCVGAFGALGALTAKDAGTRLRLSSASGAGSVSITNTDGPAVRAIRGAQVFGGITAVIESDLAAALYLFTGAQCIFANGFDVQGNTGGEDVTLDEGATALDITTLTTTPVVNGFTGIQRED